LCAPDFNLVNKNIAEDDDRDCTRISATASQEYVLQNLSDRLRKRFRSRQMDQGWYSTFNNSAGGDWMPHLQISETFTHVFDHKSKSCATSSHLSPRNKLAMEGHLKAQTQPTNSLWRRHRPTKLSFSWVRCSCPSPGPVFNPNAKSRFQKASAAAILSRLRVECSAKRATEFHTC